MSPSHSKSRASRSSSSPPKRSQPVQPYSRHKVDRLPPPTQALVFRGFARSDSYATICKALSKLGFHLSQDSLSRYRRHAWNHERNRLKRGRAMMEVLKESFLLDPDSTTTQIAQEMLYTAVCNKMFESEEKDVLAWLREAREQRKVGDRKSDAAPSRSALSEVEIDRRIREIYGLPPKDSSSDPDDDPQS